MCLASRLTQRVLRLPPPISRDLVVTRDLRVPMRDDAVLLSDRWTPSAGAHNLPTALIRSPYGRAGMFARQLALPLAERGFQVLIRSTRGTFGSGGDFDPLRCERDDGTDTLDWVVRQPWFGTAMVLVGGSYLGHVQWAVADRLLHLQPGGGLAQEPLGESDPDGYRYDPGNPTPAVGGVRVAFGVKAGRVNNAKLESRPDVLTFTSATLDQDVEVIGEVNAEIWFSSSLSYADVFVRLCDVDDHGRSFNVCDGLVSLTGTDQTSLAAVRLWPTAYRFRRGHRIRVQVSSGAFPRYNRNPGTGAPRASATTLRAADHEVFHHPAHPSAVILPVREQEESS